MNDNNRVLARRAGRPPANLEDQARPSDRATLAGFTAPSPVGGGRTTSRVDGLELFQEKVPSEKLIKGWIAGPRAEAADLRGIRNLMLECPRSHR